MYPRFDEKSGNCYREEMELCSRCYLNICEDYDIHIQRITAKLHHRYPDEELVAQTKMEYPLFTLEEYRTRYGR